jgi:hypothetical protein
MENFFGGISDAFSYFGGTTRIAKSDNMQQWVKKYDRYEPAFNVDCVENERVKCERKNLFILKW